MNPIVLRHTLVAGFFLVAFNARLLADAPVANGLSADLKPAPILQAMQAVGDWQLAHPETNRVTGWISAVGDVGIMALAGR
jgi:hypothetical protein